MGYTTDFEGRFNLDRPLSDAHFNYLTAFARTRRMKRNPGDVIAMADALREACGLHPGVDGGFYVGGKEDGFFGQKRDHSIIDYNVPPGGQPGLWCQWVPTEDKTGIEWDGGEKFYNYTE